MNNPRLPTALATLADAYATDGRDDYDIYDTCDDSVFDLPAAPDTVLDDLPEILRIQSVSRTLDGNAIHHRAELCHRGATVRVAWDSQQVDTRIHRHALVTLRRAATVRVHQGAIRIQRLLPADRPNPACNLFETLPAAWVKDPDLVRRAADLWAGLPRPLAHLVNALLWDGTRLHRFVTGPSSLHGHHAGLGGNFRHSIEVAERSRDLGSDTPRINLPLLITGGLIHDLAKAAEYQYDRRGSRFLLSARGQLIGHRDTLIEWLAVARTQGVIIDEATWLGLLHMLNAARGAPAWIGLREPRSLEAELLATADRLSGHQDLHQQCAPTRSGPGFGQYHRHLGHRTYVTPPSPVAPSFAAVQGGASC